MAEHGDQRPMSSLFESPWVEVYFSDAGKLCVPSSLFDACPELRPAGQWPRRDMTLDGVTLDVGHVLFYYLLTGTYQSLRPKGESQHERHVNELLTTIEVYNTSRKYDLSALQETAKGEVQRLAKVLPFPLVLNLLRNLHLSEGATAEWLDEYVQWGLKNIFQNPTAFVDDAMPQVDNGAASFSNIILKSLTTLLANGAVTTSAPAPEPVAAVEEPVLVEEQASPAPEAAAEQSEIPQVEPEVDHKNVPDAKIVNPESKSADDLRWFMDGPSREEQQEEQQQKPTEEPAKELAEEPKEEPTAEPSRTEEEQPSVETPLETPVDEVRPPLPRRPDSRESEPQSKQEPEPQLQSQSQSQPEVAAEAAAEPAAAEAAPAPTLTKPTQISEPTPVRPVSRYRKKKRSFFSQLTGNGAGAAAPPSPPPELDGENSSHEEHDSDRPVPPERPLTPSVLSGISRIRYLGR